MNRFHLLALSSVVALASSACIIQTNSTVSNGTFELDWSIAGGVDPSSCTATQSSQISIVISGNGQATKTYTSPCSNFATYVDLPPGSYSFAATMLNGAGTARTTAAQNTFTISSNTRTVVPVDYPLNAFF